MIFNHGMLISRTRKIEFGSTIMGKKAKGAPAPDPAIMLTTVTEHTTSLDGEFFKIATDDAVKIYDFLKHRHIIQEGDFSGVSVERTAKTEKQKQWYETSAGYYSEDSYTGSCPRHWVNGEGYYNHYEVFTGYTHATKEITTSKRADIRRDDENLYFAQETIDLPVLKEKYEAALEKTPVDKIMGALLGEGAAPITKAFNRINKLKPLSLNDTLDPAKVSALQSAHAAAVKNVQDAVGHSGIVGILPFQAVQSLVTRATGRDLLAA